MLPRSILYNLIYRSNTIPIIILSYFVDISALILNLIWKGKKIFKGQTPLKKKKRTEVHYLTSRLSIEITDKSSNRTQ